MTPPVLVIQPETTSHYRNLVRPCHKRKHLLIINESYDSSTKSWNSKDGKLNLPLNYIKHICEYVEETDCLRYTKTPSEEELKRLRSPTAPLCLYYLPPVTVQKQKCRSFSRTTRQLFADTDDLSCRWGRGNFEEACLIEEEANNYWDMTPTTSPVLHTQIEFDSPSEPKIVQSDEEKIPETPPASQCYAPKGKQRKVELCDQSPDLF